MRRKNYKGRCEKRVLGKSTEVCRLYDELQALYANRLQECEEISPKGKFMKVISSRKRMNGLRTKPLPKKPRNYLPIRLTDM